MAPDFVPALAKDELWRPLPSGQASFAVPALGMSPATCFSPRKQMSWSTPFGSRHPPPTSTPVAWDFMGDELHEVSGGTSSTGWAPDVAPTEATEAGPLNNFTWFRGETSATEEPMSAWTASTTPHGRILQRRRSWGL